MNRPGAIAAVVLAAGRSSRMGAPKPLLPLGSTSVIERVVGAVARAGVDDIVVVTGHEPERLAPVLDRLPVRPAHNPGYDAGMFSSVRAGVAALGRDVEAFFVLPADYPLVRTEVLSRLIADLRDPRRDAHDAHDGAVAAATAPGILHPTCCGRRGHPPLLSGRYREALLDTRPEDDLRSFLQRHAEDEAEVEVEDVTILLDMDTIDDYQRLCRFAAILDGAAPASDRGSPAAVAPAAAPDPEAPPAVAGFAAPADPALSAEDALYLLSLLEVPDRVVRHCRAVAQVGAALAQALLPYVPSLDVDLISIAGLLHDVARISAVPRQHAHVGARLLSNLGLPRLSSIVDVHMVLPPEQVATPVVTEAQLLYLADKLVAEDRVVSLEERTARTLRELGGDAAPPEAHEGMRSRMQAAQRILDRVEQLLRRPLTEVLAGTPVEVLTEVPADIVTERRDQASREVPSLEGTDRHPSRHTLVCLARHAEPVLPDNRKRFVGSSDPPLSPAGIEQARRLAEELRPVMFDSIHSSDLRRCLETAEIVREGAADPAPPIRPDPRLREIDAGRWEWLTFDEAADRYPDEYAERERDLVGYRFPGGESFRELRDRVLPAFLEIVSRGGANILVISHLGVNRVLLCELLGLPVAELFSIKQGYASFDLVEVRVLPDGSREIEVATRPNP